MKYIFVTGGVVSGLGKGITAASLGRLLKQRGFKVIAQKLDPYINVDPGTMSPSQHGEVFVTEDGAETDLDLGHYERFMDENLNKYSNLTSGKVYWNVLHKERRGEYLGQTVQIIPHITDEIKRFIYAVGEKANADIVITEIGGTVGDIESQPFIEAMRQIMIEKEGDVCEVHVTLVPYISGSDEYKSKPTQHSVMTLQSMGVRANIIVARCNEKLPDSIKDKIALFCNVKKECVIENTTVNSLYEAPLMLEDQDLSRIVCEQLNMEPRTIDLSSWQSMVKRIETCQKDVTIGLVGKYITLHDAYLSVVESLKHGGYANGVNVHIKWIDAENVNEKTAPQIFCDVDGIIVPGGFGSRGIDGMVYSATYARIHNIPYLGICLGMQISAIAFARSVLGYEDANSNEFDEHSKHKVIDFMDGQFDDMDKGGTMRLGAYDCLIKEHSQMAKWYGETNVKERHRHRYEFNNQYRSQFEENGMHIVGTSKDGNLVEAIEFDSHPFYIGVQFHPEFKSRPDRPHPLFIGLISSAIQYHCE